MWIKGASEVKRTFAGGPGKRGLKGTWWKLLQEVQPHAQENARTWPEEWMAFAGSGDRSKEHGARW